MARRRSKSQHHKDKHKRYENSGRRKRNKERRITKDWKRSREYREHGKSVPQKLLDRVRSR